MASFILYRDVTNLYSRAKKERLALSLYKFLRQTRLSREWRILQHPVQLYSRVRRVRTKGSRVRYVACLFTRRATRVNRYRADREELGA